VGNASRWRIKVMGTWGVRTFESDEALEWADAFSIADDPIKVLEYALPTNPSDLGEIEGLHVLRAAEAIIAILARPRFGSRIFFDDASSLEADAVRLKPRCLTLLQHILTEEGGYRALWLDKHGNANPEWEAEVRSLVEDLENTQQDSFSQN
jgi:hypothetical protein